LAAALGLAQHPGEAPDVYRRRIQKEGILATPGRVEEAFFLQARQEVLVRLAESSHPEDALALSSLLYGRGFATEREQAEREGGSSLGWKTRALDNSWGHVADLIGPCEGQYARLVTGIEQGALPPRDEIANLSVRIDGADAHVACGMIPDGFSPPDADFLQVAGLPAAEPGGAPTQPQPGFLARLFGGGEGSATGQPDAVRPGQVRLRPLDDVLIDDRVHLATLRSVDGGIRRRRLARDAGGGDGGDLYSPEILYWYQDFRVLLGMKYVSALAGQYGVRTDIREVLSMPLGASEITLEEAVSVYQGLTTGSVVDFPGEARGSVIGGQPVDSPPAPTLLIAQIRDVDGNILYEAKPQTKKVARQHTAELTTDILRNVVLWGTGRRALDAVVAGDRAVPVGGKTGTTNDFKNAAFIGYAPRTVGSEYLPDDGFTVGVYVGYDDNRPLDVGNLRVDGAKGALPAWILAVRGLQEHGLLGEPSASELGTGASWPLHTSSELHRIAVDEKTGLPTGEDGLAAADSQETPAIEPSILVVAAPQPVAPAVEVKFEAKARPFRIAPRTEDADEHARKRRAESHSVWEGVTPPQ
jgi:hypothetical protein